MKISTIRFINGKGYLIDSAWTFDCGYETMIFPCELKYKTNPKNEIFDGNSLPSFNILNWNELYVEHHMSPIEMKVRHSEIVENLEEILNENQQK